MTRTWRKAIAQSLPDQVAQSILERIATGELLPGHRVADLSPVLGSMFFVVGDMDR